LDENYNKKTSVYNEKMNFFYYQIAIPLPIKGTFTYKSKVFLKNGSRAQVSFRNKKVMGVVIKQIKKIPEYKVKEIVETFQENLAFESNEFECLTWASKYYHHPIGDVFSTFMPKLLKDNKKSLEKPSNLDKNKHTYEINLENKPFQTYKTAT
jgi:primosomal protein N' (replication factor Y)